VSEAQRLRTIPEWVPDGNGLVLIIGRADRFQCGKQIASYLDCAVGGVEWESATARNISRTSLLRFLLVEAAQVTVRSLPEWRSKYFHLAMRTGTEDRQGRDGPQTRRSDVLDDCARDGITSSEKFGSHADSPESSCVK